MAFRFNFSSQELGLSEDEEIDFEDQEVEIIGMLHEASLDDRKSTAAVPVVIKCVKVISQLENLPETLMAETITLKVNDRNSFLLFKRHLSDIKCQIALDDDMEESEQLADCSNFLDLTNESDLVKGVYEGGLKTWECSIDLVEYLVGRVANFDAIKVLELGCGSGLPGIYMLNCGKSMRVDFQDYNQQVINLVTIPNILLNTVIKPGIHDIDENGIAELNVLEDKNILKKALENSQFFAGDWNGLIDVLNIQSSEEKYDLLLTSETIYNPDSAKKLYDVIKNILKPPKGIALVSAKTMYFGVGGGTLVFRQLVERDNLFAIKVVHTVTANVKREILELTFLD
ncbi:hypothetical protein G9A89_004356 [Geosiphon pyriformis]|nr:hypothetical protein G9A89_004356 [Geosiphon pyriformis]